MLSFFSLISQCSFSQAATLLCNDSIECVTIKGVFFVVKYADIKK